MFQFSSNFLERVSLFQGLKEILSTNEIQANKPHLINGCLIFLPLFIIHYAMLKYSQYWFNKHEGNNESDKSAHQKYSERKVLINKIFNFFYTVIIITYLFNLFANR